MQIDTIYGPIDSDNLLQRITTKAGSVVVEYVLNGEVVLRTVSTALSGTQATAIAKA